MRIAIIGAGGAGLASLRHSLDEGHDCVAFEQSGQLGGTWNYTDRTTGVDEYGLPVHSSMYKGLRTNLPKELMQYEDFPYKEPQKSYISQAEVLNYMNNYANSFNLLAHIQFFKHVLEIDPSSEGKWKIKIKDLKTNNIEQNEYDAVFLCVGNYSVPRTPKLQGMDQFKGTMIHSHLFRKPDGFKDRTVLIVGAGPSGVDICRIVAGVAKKVFVSIRSGKNSMNSTGIVSVKPEIKEFEEGSVIFKDDSKENIDDVIFCTGYFYSYPFLSPKCGITVEDNWVKYLYKDIVNVEHPTMAFIGVPFRIFPFPIFGIQVRFFLAFLKGKVKINKEDMLKEINQYMLKKKAEGYSSQPHFLGLQQGWYMDDLADTAGVKRVPPVLIKLYKHLFTTAKGKYPLSFKILNDNEFAEVS